MRGLIIYIHSPSVFILQYFPSCSFMQASVLCGLCCIVNISVFVEAEGQLPVWNKFQNWYCHFYESDISYKIMLFIN